MAVTEIFIGTPNECTVNLPLGNGRKSGPDIGKLIVENTPPQQHSGSSHLVDACQAKSIGFKITKRAFDIASSGIALVLLSPVFLATAIAIVAEDGRPVIYSAEREGKDGKPFRMHKFRSMYKDADKHLAELLQKNEQTGAAFKIKDDPRITKVGRFIRKYSIDELPQLVNVLNGQMSVVGPRPIVPVREFTPYERQRQIVRPGLTCYWQISGRADISWEEWMEMDLDYIRDMGILADAKIIAKTFKTVLKGEGGY